MKEFFAPIAMRSHYSLLSGIHSPEYLCDLAVSWGSSVIGITDRCNWYGLPQLRSQAARCGLSTITGIDFSDEDEKDMVLLVYARCERGFAVLNRLVSDVLANEELVKKPAAFCAQWLLTYGIPELAVVFTPHRALQPLEQVDIGGVRRYAGLTWGLPYHTILQWAATFAIPSIGLNRGVWHREIDRKQGNIRRAIKQNIRVVDLENGRKLQDWQQIVVPEVLQAYFAPVPQVAAETRRFSQEWINEMEFPRQWTFPSFKELSPDQAHRHLVQLCRKGVVRRYGKMTPQIRIRLNVELSIIKAKQFSSYFLVVQDIVSQTPRTCGRGSAAASIVSYLLGITHVDPLQFDLFFERFLNMGRTDPPDIDVDFPWDERSKTLEYVFRTYPGRAAMVADHATFAGRSAVREVAKALGMTSDEQTRIVAFWEQGKEAELPSQLVEHSSLLRGSPRYLGTHPGGVVITPGPITEFTHIQTSPLGWPLIAWEKDGTEDMGLVKIDLLGNRSLAVLRDCLELIRPLREKAQKPPLEWDSFQPINDQPTRELLESGQSLGVFYVESPATRQLLKKMRHASFEHLVVASSIIRPAANKYINAYVERLHGAAYEPIHPRVEHILSDTYGIMVYQEDVSRVAIATAGFSPIEADGLRKALTRKDRAAGLCKYRERFFEGAESCGLPREAIEKLWDMILSFDGYSFCKSHSASYALVSYKLAYLRLRYPMEFFTAVINNGGGFYPRQVYLNALPKLGFAILPPNINKSIREYTIEGRGVRVGFAQLRYIPDMLVHQIIDNRKRFGDYLSLGNLCSRVAMNYTELAILIRSGTLDPIAQGQTRPGLMWQAFHFIRKNDRQQRQHASPHPASIGARYGLHYKGLTKECGNSTEADRVGKKPLSTPVITELFEIDEQSSLPTPAFAVPEYTMKARTKDEYETMGILVSRHPALLNPLEQAYVFANIPPSIVQIDSRTLGTTSEKKVCFIANIVTGKQVITKHAQPMVFLTFEDPYGFIETVVFPARYPEVSAQILSQGEPGNVYMVVGKINEEFGAFSVDIEQIKEIDFPMFEN